MTCRIAIIAIAVGVVALLAVGAVAAWVLRPPATPSGELTAIPVQSNQAASSPVAEASGTPEPTAEISQQMAVPAGDIVAEIDPTQSQARFTIHEILFGEPNTVIGTTSDVAGQILIDPSNPANAQMGTVQVDARTLVTDQDRRNRTMQNQILNTGQFEFITFTPQNLVGLPDSGAVGDTFKFQIVGDLTIQRHHQGSHL